MKVNLAQLQQIFNAMSKDGFDVNGALKWTFYFIDNDKARLEKVYNELKDYKYVMESVDQDENGDWTLKVSKIDILDAEKLYRRNLAFNELANYTQIKVYDGWDVERMKN